MFVSDCLGVNQEGNLTVSGVDTVEIAKRFGTPLYVFDEATIRGALRQYKKSIETHYDGKGIVAYASKAFACKEMYRIVKQEGCGIDVVSQGELYTALSVDFPAENIFYHGNNKTYAELDYAIANNVGRIVADNFGELELISKIAASHNKVASVMIRIKPGIDAHTHDFVRTGQIDSKFGFALETGEAMEGAKFAIAQDSVKLVGIHCHIGSQIFDISPFELAAEVMLGFMANIKAETGVELSELNLGGGFGIKYVPENDPVPYADYMEKVSNVVHSICQKLGINTPFIVIEPGRSVAGPAGLTLYTVGGVKKIPDIRTYVSVDGGMTDNPRYILYQSKYDFLIANKANQPKDAVVTVAGRCCESGDLVGEGVEIQTPQVGDVMAVLATGAYNYAMASNYNRVLRAAAVMVKDGEVREIIRRESLEDIVRNDI